MDISLLSHDGQYNPQRKNCLGRIKILGQTVITVAWQFAYHIHIFHSPGRSLIAKRKKEENTTAVENITAGHISCFARSSYSLPRTRKMHTLNGEVTSFVTLLAQAKACHATTSMTVNLGSLILSHRTPQVTEHIYGLPPLRVFALSRASVVGEDVIMGICID
jgi:hypothetical protein